MGRRRKTYQQTEGTVPQREKRQEGNTKYEWLFSLLVRLTCFGFMSFVQKPKSAHFIDLIGCCSVVTFTFCCPYSSAEVMNGTIQLLYRWRCSLLSHTQLKPKNIQSKSDRKNVDCKDELLVNELFSFVEALVTELENTHLTSLWITFRCFVFNKRPRPKAVKLGHLL